MPVHTTFVLKIYGVAFIFPQEFLRRCRGHCLMLGIIGGTSLLFSTLPDLKKESIATPFGSADLLCGDIVMLMRHQHGRPPHRINYRANLAAMAIAGVDHIVAFGSSGSLKTEIAPGTLLIPTDYISVTDIPSIHDHKIEHVRPELRGRSRTPQPRHRGRRHELELRLGHRQRPPTADQQYVNSPRN